MGNTLTTNVRIRVQDHASAALKGVKQRINALDKEVQKHKEGLKTLGVVSGAAGVAMVGLGVKAISAASDLNELRSKAGEIYKTEFPALEAATKKIAQEVGRADSAVLKYATDIAAVIEPSGLARKEMGRMSSDLSKLAIDMASFHNVSDEQAFEALRSGLIGVTKPLTNLGVVMSQAALKQFALEQGIRKNIDAMTTAELMTLRYNFIMDKTTTLQSDAARTADSVANQLRRLQGNVQNLFEELGKPMLETASQSLIFINQALTSVNAKLKEMSPETKKMILDFAAITTTALLAGSAVVALAAAFVKLKTAVVAVKAILLATNPVLAVIAAGIAAVTAVIVIQKKRYAELADTYKKANDDIQGSFDDQMNKMSDYLAVAEKTAGRDAELARLRAKAHADMAATTAATGRLVSAVQREESDAVVRAIEEEIQSLNLRAGESARAAIAYAKSNQDAAERVTKAYNKSRESIENDAEDTAAAIGSIGEAAEEAGVKSEDALRELNNEYKTAMRDIDQEIKTLEFSHKENMNNMREQIKGVEEQLTDLDIAYERSMGNIDRSVGRAFVQNSEKIADLKERLVELKQEAAEENAEGSVNPKTTKRIEELRQELEKLEDAKQKFIAEGLYDKYNIGATEAFENLTRLEQATLEAKDNEVDLNTETEKRRQKLKEEKIALEENMRQAKETYRIQRTELELTKIKMESFQQHYIEALRNVDVATQETVDGMKAKLTELRNTISEIDALLQAQAGITGGGTVADRVRSRGASRAGVDVKLESGGVVNKPTVALIGEGRNSEAVVPLPDNRSIPVKLNGATSNTITINMGGVTVKSEADMNKLTKMLAQKLQLIPLHSS